MEEFNISQRNKVKRIPERGKYDRETLFRILDAGFVCHIGFTVNNQPFVIPTLYGRSGDNLFIHGATTSRMLKNLQEGISMCLNVTHVDELVLARSAFHHSMNYRSAVVFGIGKLVPFEEKEEALRIISENIIEGRWEEVRGPNSKELKATSVIAINIEEASCKIRTGPPSDDKEDYELDIWAGILPISQTFQNPVNDPLLNPGIPVSKSVQDLPHLKK